MLDEEPGLQWKNAQLWSLGVPPGCTPQTGSEKQEKVIFGPALDLRPMKPDSCSCDALINPEIICPFPLTPFVPPKKNFPLPLIKIYNSHSKDI